MDQEFLFYKFSLSLLQIDTNNSSKHLAPNRMLQVKFHVELTSFHVKAHAILTDRTFDSTSVIENFLISTTFKVKVFCVIYS